ncbi:hypothetical protein LJC01_01285 [Clostridiaceae bacterium OttesenSCG-928-D20]|nr:hypothetical protein [Clostridiaceae bacterium OttesenSCG-928-D20]
MSTYQKFYIRPAKGEQVYTVVEPNAEEKAAICGKVVDIKGGAVEAALVLLFQSADNGESRLISRFLTDEDGYFLFGPLEPETLYLIKVFKNDIKIRELEIKAE